MYDILIVGAGSAGIYSAFLAKMNGLNIRIIETSNKIGGQLNLFFDKPVYDMPGKVKSNGKEILEGIKQQFESANEKVYLNEKILEIKGEFPCFSVKTNVLKFETKTIIFATGGGQFQPIKLGIKNESDYSNLKYFVKDGSKYKNKNLVIFGGGDTAVDWAHYMMDVCKKVTLVHRRNDFRGQEKLVNEIKRKINILTPYKINRCLGVEKINEIELFNIKTKEIKKIFCDEVLVFFGQKKIVDNLKNFGFELNDKCVKVKSNMESSINGIFAIGNISHYEGKINVLATTFGEAATAIGSIMFKVLSGKKMSYITKKKVD